MPGLALAFPTIDPILFQIGPFAIRWYALAYVVGLLGGWFYARRLAATPALWGKARPPSAIELDDFLVWMALGIVLGGRVGYVLFYNLDAYLAHPLDIFAVWRGGMSFHGGLIGAALAVVAFSRKRGLSMLSMLDISAAVAPIGLCLGRIANFINSELWGRPAPSFPYAVIFPNGGPVPRHPSQLYEAMAEGVLLFFALAFLIRIGGFRRPGLVAGVFGIGYALARTVCELFREPDPQLGFLFGTYPTSGMGITMGMVLSVPVAVLGLVLVVLAFKRHGFNRSEIVLP